MFVHTNFLVCTVRRDEHNKDGSSSSPSSVEMKLIEMKKENEMVTVNNNCVNIDYANLNISDSSHSIDKNVQSKNDDNSSNENVKDEKIVNSLEAALDEFQKQLSNAGALATSLAPEKLAKFTIDRIDDLNDDDDALATSNYSDSIVSSRCEMSSLPPPSSSTSALLPHVAHCAPTLEDNRNHRQAVRKNFSLWIGVTSCVWACLVWLMKNYA